MKKKIVICFSFILALFLLVSCVEEKEEDFLVTFQSYGANEEVTSQVIKKGDYIKEPNLITKEGYLFLGWYKDDSLWDFENSSVNEDLTLRAKWEKEVFTITFTNADIEEQRVLYNDKVIKPNDPVETGNTFLGWYKDDELFDFDRKVTENLNLIAKWEVNVYTVSFDLNGAADEINNQVVNYDDLIIEPTVPKKELANFLGWYYEGRKWDFNNGVKEDMTLTARWDIRYDIVLDNLRAYYADTLDDFYFKPIEDVTLIEEIDGFPITWSSDQPDYFSSDGKVTLPDERGESVRVYLTASLTSSYKVEFVFNVVNYDPEEPPVFTLTEEYEELMVINWNESYDPFKGVRVIDDYDGIITNDIEIIKDIDNQEYGKQTITLSITNSFGKTATMNRYIEVIWDYDVTFIGHAGSYYGLMNSEEAILYAIKVLKYQAIEVDLKQTKDGVFVLCHDDDFGGYKLAQTNWSILKDVKVTAPRKAGIPGSDGSVTNSPYTAGLLTLERYLEICKENNVDAVIELKASPGITNSNQSRMQAFMDVVEEAGMLNNVILLGSQHNCLIWTRLNGYEYIPCQYLVGTIESSDFLNRCIDNNLDISTNISGKNSDEWISRYQSKGIKVAVYTFSQYVDYNVLQSWIDRGVDFVTVDWHLMSELDLPLKK